MENILEKITYILTTKVTLFELVGFGFLYFLFRNFSEYLVKKKKFSLKRLFIIIIESVVIGIAYCVLIKN